MYPYAQVNDDNVCIAVSQLAGEVDLPNMIPLDEFDAGLLTMVYVNGEFVSPE